MTLRSSAFVALLVIAAAGLPPLSARAEETTVKVSLLLVCDIYDIAERGGRGGLARVIGAIKGERAKGGLTIVAHAGDMLSPSLISGFDKGAHMMALTNLMAPDIFVPGNHEYDFGEDVFRARMAEATFPLLAANLRDKEGRALPGFAGTKMLDFGGVKIGVIGLTADDAPVKSSPGTLTFLPTVDTARTTAAELRKAGADLVVAVAHADRRADLRLFYNHDVDVLLSGDDHDLVLLYDGKTAMAEAKSDGEVVTAIDLEIRLKTEGDQRQVSWWPRFRVIDTADVAPDPDTAEKVAVYEKQLSVELDQPIGTTTTALDSRKASVRSGETAIGNLIADALRATAGADLAITNGGGIRGDRTYDAGTTLKRRDILSELPFGNKLVKLKISGADLKTALEAGVWFADKPNGRFPQVSGVELVVAKDAVPGARITALKIGGAPLDPAKVYTLATNDFIASGRDGYEILAGAERLLRPEDGELMANAVIRAITAAGSVAPKVEGRIRFE